MARAAAASLRARRLRARGRVLRLCAAALRLREDYLAITTFGIAVVIQLVALNAQWLTGGPFGIQSIPRPLQSVLGTGLAWNLAYLGIVALIVALLA